jgi:hypothetical protein
MARRWLEFVAMAAVALVTAHNLVFVLAYGAASGEALARSGHGDPWTDAVLVVLGAGAGLLATALWRLRQLGLHVGALARAVPEPEAAVTGFGRGLAGLWARLTIVTALLFLVQENAEHLQAGEALPGLGVLGSSEYPNALLVIAGVALVVALVGTLIRWRRAILIARFAAARRPRLRPASRARPACADPDRQPGTILGRALAVRAPPALPAT